MTVERPRRVRHLRAIRGTHLIASTFAAPALDGETWQASRQDLVVKLPRPSATPRAGAGRPARCARSH